MKVLHVGGGSHIQKQLKSEACLLAQLNHSNVVRVWDFEDDASTPYLVLEFIEGMSLGELIRKNGAMRPLQALRIVSQIADGLAAAHRLGIVHRDVKPGNILLAKDGTAKLADLGLAVFVDSNPSGGSSGQGMAGTVAYMPPEQAMSARTVDHRSDMYALGATFYHLVTGQIPFQGATRMEVILKHAKEPLKPPHEVVPDFPREVSDVIVKMMAKAPADRYQTYDDLLDALWRGIGRPHVTRADEAERLFGTTGTTRSHAD